MHYQRARYHDQLDQVAPDGSKACTQCGIRFEGRRWGAMFCSRKCHEQARYYRLTADKVRPTETCLECSTPLTGNRQARYCSTRCADAYRNRSKNVAANAARVAALPPCPACGRMLPPGSKRRTFCSDECKVEARQAHMYGLTVRELHELMERQGRACAICRTPDWGVKGPSVDHCHTTGAVRGILCGSCNNGLGRFRDDPARLRAAAAYLER